MEYLDLADPVGVEVQNKTEGDLMYSYKRKSNSRLEIGKNAPPYALI